MSPGFFHNGAFIRLEDAVAFHLSVVAGARRYEPGKAGVPADLAFRLGPPVPVNLIDPLMRRPIHLDAQQFSDLVSFLRDGLLDPRVNAVTQCQLVPPAVPSGRPVLSFEACP